MRRAASFSGLHASYLWRPYGFYKRRSAYMTMRESPRGMEASIGCAAGESSRKPRRPRPYSRAFAGMALRSASRPKAAHCRRRHVRTGPPRIPPLARGFKTMRHLIATRHATSLQTPFPRMPPTYGTLWSFKRRGTPRRYKRPSPYASHLWDPHKRWNPHGALGRVPLWNAAV